MSNTSELTDLIIKERVKGLSYYNIETKHGIPAEQAILLAKEALATTSLDDEWEQRGIQMLRLERVVEYMWNGVETGAFKSGEVLLKAIEQLTTLLDSNKKIIEKQKAEITDQQAEVIYSVMAENNRQILEYIKKKFDSIEDYEKIAVEWPEISAESATAAVEAVLYVEAEDE